MRFYVDKTVAGGGRCGRIETAHGKVRTPAFMPVGTYGTVRGLTPLQLCDSGAEMVLANAYHLALRPGTDTITKLGGLHRFMGWDGPILTDSGGFQLFSLVSHVKVDDDGASLRSPIDGASMRLTPESVVRVEQDLGVDIGMAFDVVTAQPGDRRAAEEAGRRTLEWARRSRTLAGAGDRTAIFGIMQGGLFEDLRRESAARLTELDFPGYAVGGLSVGEERNATADTAQLSVGLLPAETPRYMMGMGTPLDLVSLAGMGYDLFDCVMPTRNARNGTLFTERGTVCIRNAEHACADQPIEEACDCYACAKFSRGYLHHLVKRKEMLGATLASLHNLRFYQRTMTRIRNALRNDGYSEFARGFRAAYQGARS